MHTLLDEGVRRHAAISGRGAGTRAAKGLAVECAEPVAISTSSNKHESMRGMRGSDELCRGLGVDI